jgi:glutamine amidotransferase
VIAIIDSGGANIASVLFALERLGVRAELTSDPVVIEGAERVILPGVGAARNAMKTLQDKNLVECIRNLRQPVLGICLGMQLLFTHSEEGDVGMLGVIPGAVAHFKPAPGLTVPHMGWNDVALAAEHALLAGIPQGSFFYFVHSYHAPAGPHSIGACTYGETFPAIVAQGNFMGCQFHPERSGAAGARLLRNFTELKS